MNAGEVLIRQKGYWYRPGKNTYLGKDFTIHATVAGKVSFSKKKVTSFSGSRHQSTVINIEPAAK